MKKIVRGNDLYLRIPVRKSVGGELFAFPLAACEEIHVRLVNSYKRYELSYTIWEKDTEGATLLAKVEGDQLPCGCYALEVRGKLLGNDWRSNEYEQLCFVENNASADTEFEQLDNGEDSVELDTQIVLMGASEPAINPMGEWSETVTYQRGDAVSHDLRCWWAYGENTASEPQAGSADWVVLVDATPFRDELQAAADNANEAASEAKSATADVEALAKTFTENEAERIEAEAKRVAAEASRVEAESARVTAESGRVDAEKGRVSAETARVSAESARAAAESARETAESKREADSATAVSNANAATAAAKTATEEAKTATANADDATAAAKQATANAKAATTDAQTATAKANASAAKCDTATAKAETAAGKADTATANANTAEAARAKAETERVTAESARAEAETARETASATAVTNAETATASAETATKAANEAASKATTAATNADTATAKATASATLADTASAKATAAASDAESAAAGAYSAATDATNAATDAKTATGEAERVNAQLDGNVFKVTDRTGETKSLDIEALVTEEEKVTVQIASEVASVSVAGIVLSVYLNHGSSPTKYTTDSEGKATFSVPIGAYYEIYFPDFADTEEISPIGYTATLPSRTIEVTYKAYAGDKETVTIEVKTHVDGVATALAGATLTSTINGEDAGTLTTDDNGQATLEVPIGKEYSVTLSEVQGYYVFGDRWTQTKHAHTTAHTVHFNLYQYKTGVHIMDNDGYEYTLDEWTAAGKTADDAAFITVNTEVLAENNAKVMIDPLQISKGEFQNLRWCTDNVLFESIINGYTYDGEEQTAKILDEAEEKSLVVPAFTQAVTYKKTVGGVEMTGYVGSMYQWIALWANVTSVDEVMVALYGDSSILLSDISGNKWSSDQSNASQAFVFNTVSGVTAKNYERFTILFPFFAF